MTHKLKMKQTQNKHVKLSADTAKRERENNKVIQEVVKTKINKRSTECIKQPKHVEFCLVCTNNKPRSAGFEEQACLLYMPWSY